jgi:hypothetical protein
MASKMKKSLPKRCTNEKLKARRKASWARGAARKLERVAAQRKREAANRLTRAQGQATPHEIKLLVAAKNKTGAKPRVRNEVGNFLVEKLVDDEHGAVLIVAVEPCCNAKSYKKCHCTPKVNMLDARERWVLDKNRSQYLKTLTRVI